MSQLNLKATHAAVKKYYEALENYKKLGIKHETAVKDAFADILKHCARQFKWTLVGEYSLERKGKPPLKMDGVLLDPSNIRRAIWEAKDEADNLEKEVKKKTELGYPTNNILFQQPTRAVLLQSGKPKREFDLTDAQELADALTTFFEFKEPEIDEWEQAVEKFSERIPELANNLKKILDEQQKVNKDYATAFAAFAEVCRQAINPNIADDAVERMLIQHLLTERIFRKIFNNPEFRTRNVIAAEIEKVITALTKKSFSRDEFLAPLEHFYKAIEKAAEYSTEWTEKQSFLINVYERFFQSFSAKEADTHGIVYTPLAIVRFMVRSVEEILKNEFGRSLSDENVHILDPFVGTGTFVLEVMKTINRANIEQKYKGELHCNEIMLLPYYIASMNIEHQFFEVTNRYEAFEGICLVDTFELAESVQRGFGFMSAKNTERVERQKKAPIFVVIGNPPYNMGQANENDHNKNRKYEHLDKRVQETYTRSSKATLKNKLSDPYAKAFRFASDRVGESGIVCFVSNSSFVNQLAFDGMRKHLVADFDSIHVLDLGGNVRQNPKLSGTTHNVFGIQVGVAITFLVRNSKRSTRGKVFYHAVPMDWRREQKERELERLRSAFAVTWTELVPDSKGNWLTEGEQEDFNTFLPIGDKEAKLSENPPAIFRLFSLGVATNRDTWVYSFSKTQLAENVQRTVDAYMSKIGDLRRNIEVFTPDSDDESLKWTDRLIESLKEQREIEFHPERILHALYRPFTMRFIYFDHLLNQRRYQQHRIWANGATNSSISLNASPSAAPFHCLANSFVPDLHFTGDSQCFPFYTYEEDGSDQRENITDWARDEFRKHYADKKIAKWDIFHYVYAVLHHPAYRERYAANLKRELPRIPYATNDSFWPLVKAGKRLMEIHLKYENQSEYKLKQVEKSGSKDKFWRVEKMRLSKDKTQLVYNEWLTLSDIPKEVYDYKLGNRSALEWLVDQYQVSTDKRSGIVNDPNREDDPQYIYKLVKKVITVSLETVEIVKGLPDLGLPKKAAQAASS